MTQDFLEIARNLIKTHEYLMISKSWCPDCHYAYKVWEQNGVRSKIHIIEFDKMPDQSEAKALEDAFVTLAGIKWVPTLFFHGSFFGTEKDLKNWEAQGKLKEIFRKEGLIE
ncbi:Glutaredoxin-8 [Meyerozyma sp. JA9]|jgi:glutaredoxin 3|nr:Glutaredoxin-8 [Meyerozyma sp. JA9]